MKFHFNDVIVCAIFLQNYLSQMKMFHLESIYLLKKKIQESITTQKTQNQK